MSYATLTDLETCFGADEINVLSDRDNDCENDADVVEKALSDASDEINSYVSIKYQIPIVSVSNFLNRICCDIARYYLHDNAAIDEVEKRYKRAISWLKDVADGKALLTDSSGGVLQINKTAAVGSIQSFSEVRQFSDKTMVGY